MSEAADTPELIRMRGQVQGVGFRPTVSRLATQLGLPGWVKNDADGVLIALGGDAALRTRFVETLLAGLPPLARVLSVSREPLDRASAAHLPVEGFRILASSVAHDHAPAALVLPDAGVCPRCAQEVLDASARRYRYPFTNCTHCGPRYSIMLGLPWDRARTSMGPFEMCEACRAEYENPSDRRYHAEPIACLRCGPRVRLSRSNQPASHADVPCLPSAIDGLHAIDAIDAVASLLLRGDIIALKGLGGYHLLADATQEPTIARLRSRKRRPHKPFALMARDLELIEHYCFVTPQERQSLLDPSAPIVLLRARASAAPPLAPSLHPLPPLAAAATPLPAAEGDPALRGGWDTARWTPAASSAAHSPFVASYGFMLPTTPLHLLALQRVTRPVVCTSGNRSEEPQVIDDAEAHERLGDIADWIVSHDRPIHNRVDDSVVRHVGARRRVLRRARGLAPAPLPLPPGFDAVARREAVWAAGADLKAAVCMSRERDLLLSQHLGDLDDARTYTQYAQQGTRLAALFEHQPSCVALDNHPDSRAAKHALALAQELGVPSHVIAHHHAHFAACLGEHLVPLDGRARIGVVLDGIGMGDAPGALWGCEVFVGDYARVERRGSLLPTPLLGGDRAAREPWRCLYAQLRAAFGWPELEARYGTLPCVAQLRERPVALLEQLLERRIASPRASSCGRLFDAVAAALGICFEQQTFEAQAAQALEAMIDRETLARAVSERAAGVGYELGIRTAPDDAALLRLDPTGLWAALLADLARQAPAPLLAARFHVALAAALANLCTQVAARVELERGGRTLERVVALSGGCLQNAVLQELLTGELEARDFVVLTHADVPANDGGIALGQALVTLARCAQDPSCTRGTER